MQAVLAFSTLSRAEAAELSVAPIFSDGVVLQRDQPVSVWGYAQPGIDVTVEFANQEISAKAEADGHWLARLGPMPASAAPRVLRVKSAKTIEIKDVLVGEVWLCAGQSNMRRRLGPWSGQKPINGWEQAVAEAAHPTLRSFIIGDRNSDENAAQNPFGRWQTCSPETAVDFPAIPYFFARDLQAHLAVPVGIVTAAQGGSPIEAWMSAESLASMPEGRAALVHPRSVPHEQPATFFDTMIAPITPLSIRGILWYQGESNRRAPENYRALLGALIGDWRGRWRRPDLPFLFVQLPPHKQLPPELREAQRQVALATPSSAMISIIDLGDPDDLHPAEKAPVGKRLALAARALAFGEPVLWSGPTFSRARRDDRDLVLYFDFTAGGLDTCDGKPPRAFELAGEDGVYHAAEATLLGDRLLLRAPAVPEPRSVRHGWAAVPDINLVNTHGLPAGPFLHPLNP